VVDAPIRRDIAFDHAAIRAALLAHHRRLVSIVSRSRHLGSPDTAVVHDGFFFGINIIERISPKRLGETRADNLGAHITPSDCASRNCAPVAILAAVVASGSFACKRIADRTFRPPATVNGPAIKTARLANFRGIDSKQANPVPGDINGVAIHDPNATVRSRLH
jgi:hypothetical protein